MTEKRSERRVALDIYLNKYKAGVPYLARASNISKDGVALAHFIEPRPSGHRVGLQFQLPGSDEIIYAEGEVVREWAGQASGEEGSGVRFTQLTERHQRMIEQFIARAAP